MSTQPPFVHCAALCKMGSKPTSDAVQHLLNLGFGWRHERPKPWAFLLLLGAIGALGASQEMTGTNWSAIYVEEALGAGAGIGGLAAGLFLVGVSLGRFGAHRVQASVSDLTVLRLCAGFGILAFTVVSQAELPTLALLGFLAAGFAVGPVEPTIYRRATLKAPRAFRGAWLSTVTSISYIGYLAMAASAKHSSTTEHFRSLILTRITASGRAANNGNKLISRLPSARGKEVCHRARRSRRWQSSYQRWRLGPRG